MVFFITESVACVGTRGRQVSIFQEIFGIKNISFVCGIDYVLRFIQDEIRVFKYNTQRLQY